MLGLVLADGHQLTGRGEDVGGHQQRVAEQAEVDAGVGIAPSLLVGRHRGLVGVRPVEQPLRGDRSQDLGELADLRDLRLSVEHRRLGIEPEGQERRSDTDAVGTQPPRVRTDVERVVVRHEDERLVLGRERERGPDHPQVVAEVDGAGGLDAGDDTSHDDVLASGPPRQA